MTVPVRGAPLARLTPRRRVQIGAVTIDPLTFAGALDAIEALVESKSGGSVFTPNVDHVVKADVDAEFREAYAHASLSLADGMPLLWAARMLGTPLPEKVSGSDLVYPLVQRAAERGWRVYLLGAAAGVAARAASLLQHRYSGLQVAGVDDAFISLGADGTETTAKVLGRIREARADLVIVALGAPKQEIWIDQHRDALRPAVAIGLGATLDFVAGVQRRSPRWMSRCGLEWLYRLAQEPRRMWRRYLVDDRRFLAIFLRTLRQRRSCAPRALPVRGTPLIVEVGNKDGGNRC